MRARNEITPRISLSQATLGVSSQHTEQSKSFFAKLVSLPQNCARWLKSLSRPQLAMISAGCMIFIFGGIVAIMGLQTNSHVEAQTKHIAAAVQSGASDMPDETEPETDVTEYRVSDPMQPKYLKIPALGVKSRVRAVATKANNEMQAPSSIYDTGWYTGGSKPGYAGATVLNGHVHGPSKPGVFANLKKLEQGDMIEIERGDGEVFLYQVVRMQQYNRDAVDMAALLTPVEAGKQGVNLITCAGSFSRSDGSYQDRLIIFASRID